MIFSGVHHATWLDGWETIVIWIGYKRAKKDRVEVTKERIMIEQKLQKSENKSAKLQKIEVTKWQIYKTASLNHFIQLQIC